LISRKRKTKSRAWTILIFAAVCASICLGIWYIGENSSSKKRVDIKEYFGVNADEIAIIYNYSLEAAKAVSREGKLYLPLDWVSSVLNDKFYWSDEEELLIYTTPNEILYADGNSKASDGSSQIIRENDRVYIYIELVKTYTDISILSYLEDGANRIYINDKWEPEKLSVINKETKLRASVSRKSSIVRDMAKDDSVVIAAEAEAKGKESWLKVFTKDGYIGFIEKKYVSSDYKEEARYSSFEKPNYTNIVLEKPIVLGWHQITNMEANSGLSKTLENTSGLTVISPTWFSLSDNEGNYTSLADAGYVKEAHSKGLQVWVLIDNLSDKVKSEILLSHSERRKKIIDKLIKDVKTYDIDGINIDFESFKETAAKHYLQFIRELSVSCRKEGIVLSVDVPNYAAFNTFFKRDKLAEVVDYVINMGYDEHHATDTTMGSVASYNFVKNGINNTLTEVPKEKLINAVPFYVRIWKQGESKLSSRALGMSAAKSWVEENSVNLVWDGNLGQYKGEVLQSDGTAYIWLEEERSMALKIKLIKEADIAGVACWKLGLEPASIWSIVNEIKK
jgi:glycoside hydrolase family 18